MQRFLLLLLSLFWVLAPATAQAQGCGFLGRKIQFADGAEACVRDVPLFKRTGMIENRPGISYEAQISGSTTYAVAGTANPSACPLATFISWNWNGHDATDALPRCNARLTDAVRQLGAAPGVECRCELLVDSGKSSLSRKAFFDLLSSLDQQLIAGGMPLDVRTAVATTRPPATNISAPVAAVAAAATTSAAESAARQERDRLALAERTRLEQDRQAREALARQEEERKAREQLARQEAQRRAEQERVALDEATRIEQERNARAALVKQEEELKTRELLARQEAERRAEQQRIALAEASRIEQERQAREALTKQEEERTRREQLARQEAERRAEQERLVQAESERRLREERRALEEERTRLARVEQERSQEQARLARELSDLRRLLEERTRAETAARASLSGPSQYTERVALVIGNRGYAVAPLVNPINDARAMKERLQAVGFKVLYFEDLKVGQIGDVLEQLHSTLKPGAAFVFFYAGHGTQIDGENFFPAVDARMTSAFQMPTQSLELARVIKVAESRKSAMNLLILDACRDNPWQVASRTAARGLSKIEPAAGTLVFYATRPGSVAADGSRAGHGLFTYHLLQHLNTPLTPVEQVFKRVAADVMRESAGKQVPWVEGQLVGDFTFVER